jgi:hypothetical protein
LLEGPGSAAPDPGDRRPALRLELVERARDRGMLEGRGDDVRPLVPVEHARQRQRIRFCSAAAKDDLVRRHAERRGDAPAGSGETPVRGLAELVA